MSEPIHNIIMNNLNSDAFLRASNINTRLSLLGKELYTNIENLILDENILGNAFNKRKLDKKTIYSSNKFKLNLDALNSDQAIIDNVLIEEKHREILFKGKEDNDMDVIEEEKEEEKIEKKEEKKRIDADEYFDDINKNIDNNINKEENDTDFYKIVQSNDDNLDINSDNKNKKKGIEASRPSTLVQDLFYYKKEKKGKKNYQDMGDIFEILSEEEDKDDDIKSKEQLEKEKLEKEKQEKEQAEQEKKKEILKGEYIPIDIIEEAEKYYNLSNESKEDLYPLNTYQLTHGLCLDFFKKNDFNIKSNESTENEITSLGIDNNNVLYICYSDGKIIKKNSTGEILLKEENYKESISSVDAFDMMIVSGDDNGNIAIWNNNNFVQFLGNVNGSNNKIICVKIVEIINHKVSFFLSDEKGNFNFMKVKIHKNNDFKFKEYEYEYTPVYNIVLFPNDPSLIKKEKQSIFLILASPQNIGIHRFYLETFSLEKLKIFEYAYGQKGDFQFDISSGYGFPPVSDIGGGGKLGIDIPAANYRGSISNNIAIGNNDEETSMIVLSYGHVVQLYSIRVSEKNGAFIRPIGFIINDCSVLRACFISNSMIILLGENLKIKLINTYDFVPRVYNQLSDSKETKDFLISYEAFNINDNSGIQNDVINYEKNKKFIYNNKFICAKNSVYYITNDAKVNKIILSNYDDVLNSLCEKEDYIRMLWLLSIIFNKKTNLLNKQLNKIEQNYSQNRKKQLCDLYLMRFFITKTVPELQNKNEIYARMLLEFFMETNNFETLSEFLTILSSSGLDKYIYSNLTKYIANGDLYDNVLNVDILKNYINYCIDQNEKLLLNKVLLKLNLDTLLQADILKIISEKELINPYIYTRIKNIQAGKIDYFLPVIYLDSVFKKEYLEKKNEEEIKKNFSPEQLKLYEKQLKQKKEEMKEEIENNLKISNDYKKLVKEHNMDFFNEKTFSCHEYIGHKFLWYCNKCLSGKEYPNDTPMSQKNFEETAIKILAYLINRENIKLYLEFDSFTYLKIISKFFFDEKLFKLISNTKNKNDFTKDEEKAINDFFGDNVSEQFNAAFVYNCIKDNLKYVELNRFFLKYDFYVMTCQICEKIKDFEFEEKNVMDALIYFSELDVSDFNTENDEYNCHKKVETDKEIKDFKDKIEKYMIGLLNYLKVNNYLTDEYVKDLLKKRRIIIYREVYFYLCEEARNYKECINIKLLEYEKKKDVYSEKDKKKLFQWIKKIIQYTYDLENSKDNFSEKKYHQEFKKLLLNYLNQLCEISMEELSLIIDDCYDDDEKEDIIRHLGGGQSSALQLRYLDKFFKLKERDMNENIEKYMKYLELELDILIKDRNKRRIKKLLIDYKVLCNEKIFQKLQKNTINDCCIYICQIQGKVKEGVEITIQEVRAKYDNILLILEKPNYNPIIIDIELLEMKNYFELGLNVCQNNFFGEEKEDKQIDDSWLDLFNTACEFKIDFYPRYESNKNNNKTRDHKKIFDGLQSCIQLILEKMSDYINLNLLVDIIAKNCEKWKTIEFYTFLDKSFYSFRRSEQILRCGKNLMSTSVLIQYDDLRKIKTLGKHLAIDEEKCNLCKSKLNNNDNNTFILFKCGHQYHVGCCAEEDSLKVCYVCRMSEIKDDKEKIKQLKEGKGEDVEESFIEIEKRKAKEKKEEEKKKKNVVKNRLAQLKKLRKKRRQIDSIITGNDIYDE